MLLMQVSTAPDMPLVALLGGSIVVVFLAILRFFGKRNPRVVIATLVAFGVAVFAVGLLGHRTTVLEGHRRAEAQARLDALGRSLHERAIREAEERRHLDTRPLDDQQSDNQTSQATSPLATIPTDVSAAWLPEVDEQFEADVYPSAELASRALIREWLSHFAKLLDKGAEKPKMVRIVSDSRTLDIDELRLLEAMDEEVQQKFPEALTLVTTGPEAKENYEPKSGEVAIKLTISESVRSRLNFRSSSEPNRNAEVSGILLAAFKAPSWSFSFSTRFIEKPWLTATSEFLSLRHGTTYQVVRCNQLASSAEEATRDVLGQAANRLGHLIDPRENQGLPRAASAMMLEQLEAGNYIADRFVQKLKRPYGDVYREAVLLDVGNSNLREMIEVTMSEASAHQAATERRSATQISGVLGLLVVVGALTGLYLLLNWLTKGYYRGPLTVAVCLLGSGAIVGAVMLIGAIV